MSTPSLLPRRSAEAAGAAALLLALAAGCGGGRSAPAPVRAPARARLSRAVVPADGVVNLTAARLTTGLRDGTPLTMWGFCQTGACPASPGGAWAPGPTLVAAPGSTLTINLTNQLPVPTSLVILGQLGGGVGAPGKMDSPAHTGQDYTTFPGNAGPSAPRFTPPAQPQRVRSFGAEVAPGATQALTWTNLRPGTYLYETGTTPSLQVPMGLYGVLVVTAAPVAGTTFTPGAAYPDVAYDDDATLLFSEIDPVQVAATDRAAVAAAAAGVPFDVSVNRRFDDPACAPSCYPAAINYTPTYFLINGRWFDRTAPEQSAFTVGDTAPAASGGVLLRLVNAGSRTHVPSLVGLPLALVAEDGHRAPGNPRVQNEVLLTAGKTFDAVVRPPALGAGYAPGTYPLFDRALHLSTDNHPDGGMQGYLLVNHAGAQTTTATDAGGQPVTIPLAGAPGNLPAAVTPRAADDSYNVPYQSPGYTADVTANDVGVAWVQLASGPGKGQLTLAANGAFTYVPDAGATGDDQFTYLGNGALPATVTLHVAATGVGGPPTAAAHTYASALASRFAAPRPGLLDGARDPSGYPLTAGGATPGGGENNCGADLAVAPDGSFSVSAATAGGGACVFTYRVTNSQGTTSAPATVTVSFAAPSNLAVAVVDGPSGAPVDDYRWILQEDLTFDHATAGTPPVSARTLGTSFHRSHMPVVASGCVGPVSCGAGQSVRGVPVPDGEALARQVLPGQVALDPARRYYLSILPGDGSPPAHGMGGAQIRPVAGGWPPVRIALEPTPLPTAQLSLYVYEDSQPTNGQDDLGERGLGGFNVILNDPAGRTGDVAGQQTFDAFNMPLTNALLGTPGCPDELNGATHGTGTTPEGNLVGAVYTCPSDPHEGTPAADPARYALAGHALIKNLTPARYDVIAHPGAARDEAGEVWWQVETLEGTPAQDAFVGINEPQYFQEFGPPGPHVTIGFVNPGRVAQYAARNGLRGTHTITGKVTNQHMSRPSDVTLWDAGSYDLLFSTTCQVVLNSQGGTGPAVAAAACDADGNFTLTQVPAGSYDLAIFDQWLDQIIQNVAVTVPAAQPLVALGDLPVLSWFTQQDLNIYQDLDRNGVYDDGEPGISNVLLSVRYRDGAPSNQTLSDSAGNGILVELFPLFNWYVAEADTTRFKQTGVSVVVDGGGRPDAAGPGQNLWTSHYATGEPSARTEQPGALAYGVQGFISQRNRVDWGRAPYAQGENGGIYGTVVYSTTRPFDDMRFNVQTIWEPLVPRVRVNLYREETLPDGTRTLTQVDTTTTTSFDDFVNLVYGADGASTWQLGPDGKLRDPATGALAPAAAYPPGRQVNLQCPGQLASDPFAAYTLGPDDLRRCYDGWHGWNQVQAAPYDGRYTFPSVNPDGGTSCTGCVPNPDASDPHRFGAPMLPAGSYVVEVVTPPGYQVVKEEDKNILIGDTFVAPATQQFGALASIFILPDQATLGNANPYAPGTGDPGFQSDPTSDLGVTASSIFFPECVGALHRVPDYLSLFPQAQQVAPFAGMDRPLCDRKRVVLNDQMQSSATFFVFTEVPAAASATGIILDDATAEFNAAAPDFGEKASVPFVPVSIKDWTGREIGRTYSDQWGAYNMLTPSSWLVNPPTPSGYGPHMLVTCMNDPGPIPDPATGRPITDPAYNPAYSNFCYTMPFMPGRTTYLDTPVLPIAAFAAGYAPADCALPDATPAILRVDGAGVGPWLPAGGGVLTVTAQGDVEVLNPAYAGPFATGGLASQRTLTRHYGFGPTPGQVKIGDLDVTPAGADWSDGALRITVPPGAAGGELSITTAAGQASVDTVTVTVGGPPPVVVAPGQGLTIQDAVDQASPGDLIMLEAGTYDELVIMWKPVRLQGVGAASVVVNAAKYPTDKLARWRPRINQLFAIDGATGNQVGTAQVDPLPTQEITGGVVLLEPSVLGAEEGAGITVLAKNLPAGQCAGGGVSTSGADVTESNFLCAPSRIDGLSVTGGDAGGGIYVNGWAHHLEIANTRVYGNAGAFHGGVRVGVPGLELAGLPTGPGGAVRLGPGQRIAGLGYDVGIRIHHNAITRNGTVEAPAGNGGAGGGVALCAGTDGYRLEHNFICGNYSASHGGGVGHLGFSQGGTIASNQILFNQSFQQTSATHGGGVLIAGEPAVAGGLTLGSGDVTLDANVIRGNSAEGGHGGGVRLQQVNGADVAAFGQPARWHRITVTNNVVADNVAGYAGGGLSLADALRTFVDGNTIAANDSVGIAGVVLAGGVPLPGPAGGAQAGVGRPSPAGLVSEPTSQALLNQLPGPGLRNANRISQPVELADNIVWQNRSFFYSGRGQLCAGNRLADAQAVAAGGACRTLPEQTTTGQCVSGAAYWDLGVLGDASPTPGAQHLNPRSSFITAGYTGGDYPGDRNADPGLRQPYCNGARLAPELGPVLNPPTLMQLQVAATVDEGNNYVNLRFGPLFQESPITRASFGDYHLAGTGAAAYDAGTGGAAVPDHDLDGQPRPMGAAYDVGADEVLVPTPLPAVSPSALDFGGVSVNTSRTLTVTVANLATATAGLQLGAPTVGGGSAPTRFAVVGNTCPATLAPGGACTLTVRYAPTAVLPFPQTATLTVVFLNAPARTVSLTGVGLQAVPFFSWSAGGPVGSWGTATGTRTIRVTNVGIGPLTLSATPAVSNQVRSEFSYAGGTCAAGLVLNPGSSCTVLVNRVRPVAGTATGALTLTDVGAATPTQALTLRGN